MEFPAIPRSPTIGFSSSLAVHQRSFTNTSSRLGVAEEQVNTDINETIWEEYRNSFCFPKETLDPQPCNIGKLVTVTGFLRNKKQLSKGLMFARISRGPLTDAGIQIIIKQNSEEANIGEDFKSIKEHSAVSVTGILQYKVKKPDQTGKVTPTSLSDVPTDRPEFEIHVEDINVINSFPKDIIVGPAQKFGPDSRHLEVRFEPDLYQRLLFRSKLAKLVRGYLNSADFDEIETPILFKSTPEGAREFLVPTRKPGYAYALPQSPQQYKQILMASGVTKYFQFAKCFRDEDLRADRQPEFTQIDMEMSWTDGQGVMQTVEGLVKEMHKQTLYKRIEAVDAPELLKGQFPRMTYEEAMTHHGSDKPDLRIMDLIHRVDSIVPPNLKGMLTSIENPIIEACKFRLSGNPRKIQQFIRKFMDSADAEAFQKNPDGPPGIFVFDPKRPLEGLQAFGFEATEHLKHLYASLPLSPYGKVDPRGPDATTTFDEGDLLILQARPDTRHSGGSTTLGKLRLAIYKAAISEQLLAPTPGLHYLWVTDFPLFTPNTANPTDPGQGGTSGFSSTHHPFTAPKTGVDADLLFTDPLAVKADHYDLVLNGVELGGGSKRIHSAEIQKFIMKNVLKMSDERMSDFSHLFEALRAGCPPHAGFAIGFDRWVAVLTGRESVRDVIFFPKGNRGEDAMVGSPGMVTKEQEGIYGLKSRSG
ncbi:aspartate--tRNA ligase msd1 [Ciborinia camelliae]|nr:aspartate--tRNA ligase msd1 [Ciborinia camelliae]